MSIPLLCSIMQKEKQRERERVCVCESERHSYVYCVCGCGCCLYRLRCAPSASVKSLVILIGSLLLGYIYPSLLPSVFILFILSPTLHVPILFHFFFFTFSLCHPSLILSSDSLSFSSLSLFPLFFDIFFALIAIFHPFDFPSPHF